MAIVMLSDHQQTELTAAHPLDNPIWHALTTSQSKFAETRGPARRFSANVTTLAGFLEPTRESYDSLASLVGVREEIALFLESSTSPPSGWTITEASPLLQMVHAGGGIVTACVEPEELNDVDTPQMLTLAELTRPGPFGSRTRELGTYLGVRRDGMLLAMAGERLCFPGYTEISAVCTHPKHLGHGYAGALVIELVRRIRGRGEVPFLHVRPQNKRAVELYARLGFRERRLFQLTTLLRSN